MTYHSSQHTRYWPYLKNVKKVIYKAGHGNNQNGFSFCISLGMVKQEIA